VLRQSILAVVFCLFAAVSATRAEDYADKVKAVDADKHTVTLPIDGKDRTFKVIDKPEVQAQTRAGKRLRVTPIKEGLKGVKVGNEVTLKTERRDGEEVVTKIVVLVPEK
jgi:Cu/Ag efflux protein CusF